MDFLTEMKAKAKADKKTIVLPESFEKRNLEAAAECLRDGLANIVLIGNKEKIMEAAGSFDVSGAVFVDPENYERMDEMTAALAEARKSKEAPAGRCAVCRCYAGKDGRCGWHGFRRNPFHSGYTAPCTADFENCTRHRTGIFFLHYGNKHAAVWR